MLERPPLNSAEYDALFERCGVGVMLLDSRGRIERANGEAATLLAATADSLVGRSILDDGLATELRPVVEAALSEKAARPGEVSLPRAADHYEAALKVTV